MELHAGLLGRRVAVATLLTAVVATCGGRLRLTGCRGTDAVVEEAGQLEGGCCRGHLTATAVAGGSAVELLRRRLQVIPDGLRLPGTPALVHSPYRHLRLRNVWQLTVVSGGGTVMVVVLLLLVHWWLLAGRTGRRYNCRGIITVKRP